MCRQTFDRLGLLNNAEVLSVLNEEVNRLKTLLDARNSAIGDLQEQLDWMTWAYNQKDKLFDELKAVTYKIAEKEVMGSVLGCDGKCKCKQLKED